MTSKAKVALRWVSIYASIYTALSLLRCALSKCTDLYACYVLLPLNSDRMRRTALKVPVFSIPTVQRQSSSYSALETYISTGFSPHSFSVRWYSQHQAFTLYMV